MKKVAIYARVSTKDKQDYKRQVDELLVIAKSQGYDDNQVDVYAEKISGTKNSVDRPELDRLITNTENDPKYYDYILTSEVSRIGRNPSETRRVIDRWSDLQIPLYLQSIGKWTIENGKRDATMNIVLQVLMEFAAVEIQQMKTRSISGKTSIAKQGKHTGGINAYGYHNVGGYISINEPEAEVIRDVFSLYKAGNGIKAIQHILNDRNIPTRFNKTHTGKELKFTTGGKAGEDVKWSDNTILGILENTLYKGERNYKGEIIQVPAIVSAELFDECTALRQTKTHRNYLTDYTYLLKDKCSCGICGRNMFAKYKPVVGGDKVYICSSRLIKPSANEKNHNCGNAGVNIVLIESAIFNELLGADKLLSKYLDNSQKLKADIEKKIKQHETSLSIAEKAVASLSNQIDKLLDLYLKDRIKEPAYTVKNDALESALKIERNKVVNIKREISDSKIALTNLDNTSTTKLLLTNARGNRGELAAIFKQLLHKVIITNIDKNNSLVTVSLNIGNLIVPFQMNILLNLQGVKKPVKVYQYRATFKRVDENKNYNTVSVTDDAERYSYWSPTDDDVIGDYSKEWFTEIASSPMITIADDNVIDITKEKPLIN